VAGDTAADPFDIDFGQGDPGVAAAAEPGRSAAADEPGRHGDAAAEPVAVTDAETAGSPLDDLDPATDLDLGSDLDEEEPPPGDPDLADG
jgi:hypothetical protein